MQLTASEATCPLCKHPVNASLEHPDPTRLCEDCQRIVQRIRPSAYANVGVINQPQGRGTSQPQMANVSQSVVQQVSPAPTDGVPTSTPPVESLQAAFSEAADAEPALLDFDELFEYESFNNEASHEAPALPHDHLQDGDFSQSSALITEPIMVPIVQPTAVPLAFSLPAAETLPVAEAMQDLSDEITGYEQQSAERAVVATEEQAADSFQDEAVTNPLVQPAEDWPFSPVEYPVLLGKPKQRRPLRLTLSLVAALLVCCGVAGYFLVYRPSTQASQGGTTIAQSTSDHPKAAQAAESVVPQAPAQPVAAARENVSPDKADQKTDQIPRTANEASGGRYSLQAAAFPNESGANDFCERLKRAGVPAYTVAAEIAGRGKWFRVRVGRFETAQDAEKFASEARLRARASGLNLQLIVSSYETP